MAFIRRSGVRPLTSALRRHCEAGKPLRILTTTYTDSTEQRALDELAAARRRGQGLLRHRHTRLHAKAWLFHRQSGFSTAYIGSSNLTHSAQVPGSSGTSASRPHATPTSIAKMAAVFESYWESGDFRALRPRRVRRAHARRPARSRHRCSAPSSSTCAVPGATARADRALARSRAITATCSSSATGTGKTVMAAVDYAGLRQRLPRPAAVRRPPRGDPRPEPGDVPPRAARRGVRRDVGRRPRARAVRARLRVDPEPERRRPRRTSTRDHFDVVIVDEFHHAAAPSYETLLDHLEPVELLGLTATPERSDGLDDPAVVRRSHRRRAAAVGRHRPAVPRAVRLLRHSRRPRPARDSVAARTRLRRRRR